MICNYLKLGKEFKLASKLRQMSQNHDLFSGRGNSIVRLATDETLEDLQNIFILKARNIFNSISQSISNQSVLSNLSMDPNKKSVLPKFQKSLVSKFWFSMHFMDFDQNWIKNSSESSFSTHDPYVKLRASIDQAVLQAL